MHRVIAETGVVLAPALLTVATAAGIVTAVPLVVAGHATAQDAVALPSLETERWTAGGKGRESERGRGDEREKGSVRGRGSGLGRETVAACPHLTAMVRHHHAEGEQFLVQYIEYERSPECWVLNIQTFRVKT